MSRNSSAHDLQPSKAELVISKGWVQGVALVFVFGFFVMGFLAYRTYSDGMPQPQRVVSESGDVVFTGEEITAGQKTFRHRGLQQYGSILGYLTAAFADRNTGMTVVAVLNNSRASNTLVRSLAWQLAAIASKLPAAPGETAPDAGLPWTAEDMGAQVAAAAVCPLP